MIGFRFSVDYRINRSLRAGMSLVALISALFVSSAALAERVQNIPYKGQEAVPAIALGRDLGAANASQVLHVAVSLQPSWPDGLQQFADAVSDPASPLYR